MAVELGTFARMYARFLCASLATAWLALVAGRTNTRRNWSAVGALLGGLVYVHPIAPLTCITIVAGPLLIHENPWRTTIRHAWPGLVLASVVAAPYLYALAVLRERYEVGESSLLATTGGRTVPEEALHALTPGGTAGALAVTTLAAFGVVHLARAAPRRAIAAGLWVVLPIAFFTVIPAETRFFGRYVISALPAFLGLVAVGALGLAGRRRVAAATVVAAVLALEVADDARRLETLNAIGLRRLPAPARETVLFSSTGTPRSGRPPELLDDLLVLEHGARARLEECRRSTHASTRTSSPTAPATSGNSWPTRRRRAGCGSSTGDPAGSMQPPVGFGASPTSVRGSSAISCSWSRHAPGRARADWSSSPSPCGPPGA